MTSAALYLGSPEDKPHLPHIKAFFKGVPTHVVLKEITLLSELEMICRTKGIDRVVSTSTGLLSKLLHLRGNIKTSPSLEDYAGSLFKHGNVDIVFINPLQQLFTVPYGKFIAERFISKVIEPSKWREPTEFKWEIVCAGNVQALYERFQEAFAIAADIETFKDPLSIRCIGYTGVFIHRVTGHVSTHSIVLPMDSTWALAWMRKFNTLRIQKVFQNGKYDNSYLLRYDAYPTDWYWDTAHFFHSWYSELPKDLAFLNAFFLRSVVYWKDLAETNDLHEYYRYNAMDTWATANVWIEQLLQAPDWAKRNYVLEFPLVYPCLLAEMTGVKRDENKHQEARQTVLQQESTVLESIRKETGVQQFNPSSPVQVKTLLKALGCADLESSDEKNLKKAAYRHPLNGRILEKVLKYRGLKKLRTTYLRTDEDADKKGNNGAKEFNGRILYSLNPHGTDTGRLASREHHFWCGVQIQNIPRGEPGEPSHTKDTICADEGFYLGECDLEQAESRDTGNISGDESLIAAVSGSRDFHSINASRFFGVPYDSIYSDEKKKTLNKPLRDLSKRTNHGANYNMGPGVMVDTMGLDKIWEAKKLLNLPYSDPKEIAQHLLDQFHKTYPKLRGPKSPYTEGSYYAYVATQVSIHRKLVSRAFHHTEYNLKSYEPVEYIERGDWTRYCFGSPDKSKTDLNSLVAHGPQSLNARTLNEAFMKVFYEIALPNPTTFRLHAQIHDSILFSYKRGSDALCTAVQKCMEIPVTVRDISGTLRTFTVPAALKLGKSREGTFYPAKYWSETE